LSDVYSGHFDKLGWAPALAGGDDYELCFTASADSRNRVTELAQSIGVALTRIGVVKLGSTVVATHNGAEITLPSEGYNHFAGL